MVMLKTYGQSLKQRQSQCLFGHVILIWALGNQFAITAAVTTLAASCSHNDRHLRPSSCLQEKSMGKMVEDCKWQSCYVIGNYHIGVTY